MVGKKKSNLLKLVPQPLLDDLVAGQWLPVVGAGFSKNAIVEKNGEMPNWDELGIALAAEMDDFTYTGPLDAISSYAYQFKRAKLVEKVSELLYLGASRPGEAHREFCLIPFEIVLTTNFDLLLEQQYSELQKYCHPIVDESQLTGRRSSHAVTLVKFHGDLHHPNSMVITEDDYERFVSKNPLISTYVSNLLITKTPVFIGYSIEDYDFRQLWRVVVDRLGHFRRQAVAILVGANPSQVKRFERRGVAVVNLPKGKRNYGDVLAQFFKELRAYLEDEILPASQVTKEAALGQFLLPDDSSRMVFFAVSFQLQSQYKEYVFPVFEKYGLFPITAIDVVSPGDNIQAKIEALIAKTRFFVADISSSPFALYELQIAMRKQDADKILAIVKNEITNDFRELQKQGVRVVTRNQDILAEQEEFLWQIENWAREISIRYFDGDADPERLLRFEEYGAAVIAAITLLEIQLLRSLDKESNTAVPYSKLVELAATRNWLSLEDQQELKQWRHIRNQVVHRGKHVSRKDAEKVVNGVRRLVDRLRQL